MIISGVAWVTTLSMAKRAVIPSMDWMAMILLHLVVAMIRSGVVLVTIRSKLVMVIMRSMAVKTKI